MPHAVLHQRRALLALATLASPAVAEGFASRDLTSIAGRLSAVLGKGTQAKSAPQRVTLRCEECAGAPVVDITIGRQTDGTEQRVRAGQTTMAQFGEAVPGPKPDCRISAIQVAPAVGWVSSYSMGPMQGSTAVILRDGDMLVVRTVSADARRRPEHDRQDGERPRPNHRQVDRLQRGPRGGSMRWKRAQKSRPGLLRAGSLFLAIPQSPTGAGADHVVVIGISTICHHRYSSLRNALA